MRSLVTFLILWLCFLVSVPFLIGAFLWGRLSTPIRRLRGIKPRLLWVGNSTLSQALASNALKQAGYDSRAVCFEPNQNATQKHYDATLIKPSKALRGFKSISQQLRFYSAFCRALITADILHSFFDGGFLKRTVLARLEFLIWTAAGKRLILMPYGSDSFVYSKLPDVEVYRRLKTLYPKSPKEDVRTQQNIKNYGQLADCVIGCVGHTMSLERIDVWPVLWYPYPEIDINASSSPINPPASRDNECVRIIQVSNHGSLKGAAQLEGAIKRLKSEGYKISFELVHGRPHSEIMDAISKSDIVIDQLHIGYALGALEAASCGKPVISALGFAPAHAPFRHRSYLNECPFINADVTTIETKLRQLLDNRSSLKALGLSCKTYVEKYHGPGACVELFTQIYDKVWLGQEVDLDVLFKPETSLNLAAENYS